VLAGALAVALLVVGAGAFAWVKLSSATGGSKSADEAAMAFIEGVVTLDFGMAGAAIAPSERIWVSELMDAGFGSEAWFSQDMDRSLGLVKDSFEITINDLEVSSTTLVDSVSRSVVTGGSVRIEVPDPEALVEAVMDSAATLLDQVLAGMGDSPIWGELGMPGGLSSADLDQIDKDAMVQELKDTFPMEVTVAMALDSMGVDELFVVTVEEGGEWFTSVSMTAAQYAWEDAGWSNTDLGKVIPADQMAQADSPEAAAEQFVKALDAFLSNPDPAEFAKYLAPAESRLLSVYGAAMLDEVSGTDLVTLKGFTGKEVWQSGGVADVAIEQFELVWDDGMGDYTLGIDNQDGRWALTLDGPDVEFELVWLTLDAKEAEFSLKITGEDLGLDMEGTGKITLDDDSLSLTMEASNYDPYYDDTETASMTMTLKGDKVVMEMTDPWGDTQTETVPVPGLGDAFSQKTALPTPEAFAALTTVKSEGNWYVSPVASLLGMGQMH